VEQPTKETTMEYFCGPTCKAIYLQPCLFSMAKEHV
jgi:hypothetical protein